MKGTGHAALLRPRGQRYGLGQLRDDRVAVARVHDGVAVAIVRLGIRGFKP
jgi:hypothetical protein